MDAVAARTVRVPVREHHRCRRARGRPAAAVRRDHPAGGVARTASLRQSVRTSCRPNTSGGLADAGVAALRAFVGSRRHADLPRSGGRTGHRGVRAAASRRRASEPATTSSSAPARSCGSTSTRCRPAAYGMKPHTAGFFAFSSAYEVVGTADANLRVIARYGSTDLLVSGWLEGEAISPAVRQPSKRASAPVASSCSASRSNIAANHTPPSVCCSTPSSPLAASPQSRPLG